jgi:hypothetical protein
MNKKLPLFVLLLVSAATVFAGVVPRTEDVAESMAAPAVIVASPVSPAVACPGATATEQTGEATPEWLASSSCCRPDCSVDRDCDRICGKGLGVCRLVNSCCKACLCSAL